MDHLVDIGEMEMMERLNNVNGKPEKDDHGMIVARASSLLHSCPDKGRDEKVDVDDLQIGDEYDDDYHPIVVAKAISLLHSMGVEFNCSDDEESDEEEEEDSDEEEDSSSFTSSGEENKTWCDETICTKQTFLNDDGTITGTGSRFTKFVFENIPKLRPVEAMGASKPPPQGKISSSFVPPKASTNFLTESELENLDKDQLLAMVQEAMFNWQKNAPTTTAAQAKKEAGKDQQQHKKKSSSSFVPPSPGGQDDAKAYKPSLPPWHNVNNNKETRKCPTMRKAPRTRKAGGSTKQPQKKKAAVPQQQQQPSVPAAAPPKTRTVVPSKPDPLPVQKTAIHLTTPSHSTKSLPISHHQPTRSNLSSLPTSQQGGSTMSLPLPSTTRTTTTTPQQPPKQRGGLLSRMFKKVSSFTSRSSSSKDQQLSGDFFGTTRKDEEDQQLPTKELNSNDFFGTTSCGKEVVEDPLGVSMSGHTASTSLSRSMRTTDKSERGSRRRRGSFNFLKSTAERCDHDPLSMSMSGTSHTSSASCCRRTPSSQSLRPITEQLQPGQAEV